jgi:hypothetical protein
VDERKSSGPPSGPPRPFTGGKGVLVRVSRKTKRPVVHAPSGVRQAERLLTEAQVAERLRLDESAIAALNACCTLRPPRNAASIVAGIKARLEYSQPKPKQEIGLSGKVSITVADPYATPPAEPAGE